MLMRFGLPKLLDLLASAKGSDRELDQAIADILDHSTSPAPEYIASVLECIRLLARALPDWHWHIGYGARGIMPYVTLSNLVGDVDGPTRQRVEVTAPTVPLALLRAAVEALMASNTHGDIV